VGGNGVRCFFFKAAWWRGVKGKRERGALQARPRGGGGGNRGALARWSVAWGQWRCRVNRERGGHGRLTRGPKRDGGPGVSSGVQERAGKRG
jgi:hypothetical protein